MAEMRDDVDEEKKKINIAGILLMGLSPALGSM